MRLVLFSKSTVVSSLSMLIVAFMCLTTLGQGLASAVVPTTACPQASGSGIVAIAETICNGQGQAINGWPGSKIVPYVLGGGHNPTSPGPNASITATVCQPGDTCGVDCSGFTRWVYDLAYGSDVLKDPVSQSSDTKHQIKLSGLTNVPVASALPGDLVFFGASVSKTSHVGIYIGNNQMIDSPNAHGHPPHQVRLDAVLNKKGNGTFGKLLGYYHLSLVPSWPELGFNAQNTRFNPNETALSPSTVSGLSRKWSFGIASGSDFASPTVANDVAYIDSGNTFVAVDASTGAQLWSFNAGSVIQATSAIANGVVYVGSGSTLHALDAATGTPLWGFGASSAIESSPAISNGVIYFASADGNVYALDSTGNPLWNTTVGAGIHSSPAVANGIVYIGSDNGNIVALSATTGAQLWNTAVGSQVQTAPSVANGVVYVASSNHLVALSATTGAQLWSFNDGTNSNIQSSPAVANGVVYVGMFTKVYALEATTGAQLWSFNTGNSPVFSSPAVANGVVYAGSDNGNIYALDASTGSQLWGFSVGGLVDTGLTVINEMVYVRTTSGSLDAFGL